MYRSNLGGMKNGNHSGGKHSFFYFLLISNRVNAFPEEDLSFRKE
jgi:hypothetical protein